MHCFTAILNGLPALLARSNDWYLTTNQCSVQYSFAKKTFAMNPNYKCPLYVPRMQMTVCDEFMNIHLSKMHLFYQL